jgi:hypothetical protein
MMMKHVGKDPELITFASENNIASGKKFEFSWRIKSYSAVLAILIILLSILITTRTTFDATVLRVPGQTIQENSDGTISNLYRIKVTNKSNKTLPYHIVSSDSSIKIERIGVPLDSLKGRQLAEETFFMRKVKYEIRLMSGQKIIDTKKAIFISEF